MKKAILSIVLLSLSYLSYCSTTSSNEFPKTEITSKKVGQIKNPPTISWYYETSTIECEDGSSVTYISYVIFLFEDENQNLDYFEYENILYSSDICD